jgi:hypothetical protein
VVVAAVGGVGDGVCGSATTSVVVVVCVFVVVLVVVVITPPLVLIIVVVVTPVPLQLHPISRFSAHAISDKLLQSISAAGPTLVVAVAMVLLLRGPSLTTERNKKKKTKKKKKKSFPNARSSKYLIDDPCLNESVYDSTIDVSMNHTHHTSNHDHCVGCSFFLFGSFAA